MTVGDRAGDQAGLWPSDFDVLTRLAGLERLDVVATESELASGPRAAAPLAAGARRSERPAGASPAAPRLVAPADGDAAFWRLRDREEELAATARGSSAAPAQPDEPLSRTAVVFKRPLPYVYLARQMFPSAGVPFQAFDALPLAAEPYAAALDLVFDAVDTNFARAALVGAPPLAALRLRASDGRAGRARPPWRSSTGS